jgi:hypothetical protein
MRRITSFGMSAALYASLWTATTSMSWGQDLKEAGVLNTKVMELYNCGTICGGDPTCSARFVDTGKSSWS